MLDKTGFGECADDVKIPEYMKQGSLKEAVELLEFGDSFHFLMPKHITDVLCHLNIGSKVCFCGNCGPDEKIVRTKDRL